METLGAGVQAVGAGVSGSGCQPVESGRSPWGWPKVLFARRRGAAQPVGREMEE